jgi:hypothetical protein
MRASAIKVSSSGLGATSLQRNGRFTSTRAVCSAQIAVIRRSERIEPIPSLPFEYSLGAESFGSLNI